MIICKCQRSGELTSDLQTVLPSETEMRRAIAERDSAHDADFVYGVITTGEIATVNTAAAARRT